MTEISHTDENWPFEKELAGFQDETLSDLEEHLQSFDWSTNQFINAFTTTMNGTAGNHFHDAITLSLGARTQFIQDLQQVSEHLCDTMDRDTAVRTWATIFRGALEKISDAMAAIDPRASFRIPDISDLHSEGLDYMEGLMKALEDGEEIHRISEMTQDDEKPNTVIEPIMVQDLPELIETMFDEDDSDVDPELYRDEYGQWVIATYDRYLGECLDDLLELCPKDKYPELS